ncbi:MAG: RimK family alpha-L-glutamate ligase [Candidatus Woesearchaeota archaeon]|nr:MAG: RimK family alpha-L-glutamate ligase [Candidatus Woesearchaeota archaeon]
MKCALISMQSTSSVWTAQALSEYFDEVDDLNLKFIEINFSGQTSEVLYKGKKLPTYDAVYLKGSFRYTDLLKTLAELLKNKCYMPIDPLAYEIANDKLLTHLTMQRAGIPMPKTYISPTIDAAQMLLEKINYPVIFKFPKGTQGKGVLFIDSYATATSVLDAITSLNQSFIIQEYVESDSTDIRVFVVGDKVVASMKRIGKEGDKRSNLHKGGNAVAFDPDDEVKKIAIQLSKHLGAEICGVDIVIGPKGPLVLEANISPGLQGITESTGVNVAQKIAAHLAKKTKEWLADGKEVTKKKIMEDLSVPHMEASPDIVTTCEFRGSRILLPPIISKLSKISEDDEVIMRASKGKISIETIK